MNTTTVRIDERTHATLRELSCELRRPMQAVLAQAVESFYRTWLLEGLNAYYAELRADPEAWAEELEERRLWDNTLMDGLEDDPYPLEPDQLAELEAARARDTSRDVESRAS